MFNAGSITRQEVVLTVLYSFAGLGIAIVNDFKSIEGDRALGMNSLPVAFGIEKAKWICVGTIDLTQLGVAAYLYAIGKTAWSKRPSLGGRSWPPQPHETASEGLRLLYGLGRRAPAPHIQPKVRGSPAGGRPSCHFRCV